MSVETLLGDVLTFISDYYLVAVAAALASITAVVFYERIREMVRRLKD